MSVASELRMCSYTSCIIFVVKTAVATVAQNNNDETMTKSMTSYINCTCSFCTYSKKDTPILSLLHFKAYGLSTKFVILLQLNRLQNAHAAA